MEGGILNIRRDFVLVDDSAHQPFFALILMSKVSQPELKRFLDKNVLINIQGGRKIKGNLRGYDLFLNIVVDEAVEQVQAENNQHLWVDGARCGTVVCLTI